MAADLRQCDAMMPVEADQMMWTLSLDHTTVRLTLPALPLEGMSERKRCSEAAFLSRS